MKMIVGLGNPGRKYDHTPHNAGYEAVDLIAGAVGADWRKGWRFPVDQAEVRLADSRVLLVKPRTFMNRSGEAVGPMVRKKGVALSDLLVLVDDADLDPGRLRLRPGGGAGGHNGLKSLIERLGSEEFPRLRIGIGRGHVGQDMIEHVLGRMPPETKVLLTAAYEKAAEAAACWVKEGIEASMNRYNG